MSSIKILAVLAVVLSQSVVANATDNNGVRFKQITRDQGLSQSFVFSITQDADGYMWFGTQDGLNRFDGFEFEVFYHDANDPSSLADETVRSIILDQHDVMWIGTDAGGLARYDSQTRSFTNFKHDHTERGSIAHNRVRALLEDSAGNLWIGTEGGGLDRFDKATQQFEHFRSEPNVLDNLPGTRINSLLELNQDTVLIASERGLHALDVRSKTFRPFEVDDQTQARLGETEITVAYTDAARNLWVGTAAGGLIHINASDRSSTPFFDNLIQSSDDTERKITSLLEDAAGLIWVGTTSGLFSLNADTGEYTRYAANPSDPFSLSHDNIISIYQDQGGVLWVGTHNGLNCSNQASRSMSHYRERPDIARTLSDNEVMAFVEDANNDIWVATYSGGLNVLRKSSGDFDHIRHVPGDSRSLSSDRVMSLHVDRSGTLWAGTRNSGLNRYDASTGSFTRFRHDPADASSISHDGVTAILEDSFGTLWVGTFGGGLNAFDRVTGEFRHYKHSEFDPGSLSNNQIMVLYEDSAQRLWIGTYGGGINLFNPSTNSFTAVRADVDRSDGLAGDEIYVIAEDEAGDFWIGLKGRGLNRWRRSDREQGKRSFERFGTNEGLPSATIYSGIWDSQGNLWMGTGNGLSMLDVEQKAFRNYDTSHGLQDAEFNLAAGYSARDGRLYFGGISGFNAFYPDLLVGGGRPPPVVINKFYALNDPDHPASLSQENGRYRVTHDQDVVSFEFAALDYAAPRKNRFMYRLDGLDQEWTDAGTKRHVTYTNLPGGDYTFRVKAANHDGVWSRQDAVLKFRVQAAPWATWWAYAIYFLVTGSVIAAGLRHYRRSVQQADQLRHAREISTVQERLADAQKMARIGNWEYDAITGELWWSDEVYRLLRIERESTPLTYERYLELVHPKDRERVDDAVQYALHKSAPLSLEYRVRRLDGSECFVHARTQTDTNANNRAVRMTGTIHDITTRKLAENDIRHRADFQSLLATLSSQLLRVQPADIGEEIQRCLTHIGMQYDLDANSIWWLPRQTEGLSPTYRWAKSGGAMNGKPLLEERVPWIAGQLLSGKVVVVSDVDQLPVDAAADKQVLVQRGVKSVLIVPLLVEGALESICVFATIKNKRSWSTRTVEELQLIAESVASALALSVAMSKIEHLKNKLQKENFLLREEVKLAQGFEEIIGNDRSLQQNLSAAEKVAPTDVTALILGETGTGKELIARAIHRLSSRSNRPMVSVNCPALPATLIESELFGHEKGAFTGAQSQRRGRFELADKGTMFLDEVGELPLELQGKLLRVLQTGEFQRVGGTETLKCDVRLIAATNRDLKNAIDTGEFRPDLYYRISSFPIRLPALRERKEDIPLLAEHFVHKHSSRLGKKVVAISANMIDKLVEHHWPGNIRELESVIERALISAEDSTVLNLAAPLDAGTSTQSDSEVENATGLTRIERKHILTVLEMTNWKIAGADGAAERLNIPPSTLRSKMKRLGISRDRPENRGKSTQR